MCLAAITRCLGPILKAVVAHNVGNAQMVISENLRAARALGCAMLLKAAPALDRFLIAPE